MAIGKGKKGLRPAASQKGERSTKGWRDLPIGTQGVYSQVSCQLIPRLRLYEHNNPSCQQGKQEHQHYTRLQRQAGSTTLNNPTEVTQKVTIRTSQQEPEIGRAYLPSWCLGLSLARIAVHLTASLKSEFPQTEAKIGYHMEAKSTRIWALCKVIFLIC